MPEGFAELERELQRDPRSKKFLDLARGYQKAGRLADALKVCESGLANNPNMAQARVLHAQLLLASGDLRSASASIQKALLVLPDNVAANHLAAEIFFGLGDSGAALKHYQIVHLFDPGREGVSERIRALTAPPPPEVVPASEVDAILGDSREPEPEPSAEPVSGDSPESARGEAPALPPAAVQDPSDQALEPAGETEIQDGPAALPVIAEPPDAEPLSAGPGERTEVFPPAQEEDAVEFPAETEFSDYPRAEELSPAEAPEAPSPSAGPDLAPTTDDEEPGEVVADDLSADLSEGDLLGGGLLDIGETIRWPERAPEVLTAAPAAPEEPIAFAAQVHAPHPEPVRTAAAPAPPGTPGDSLNTLTLARLYEQQGYPEKAVEVYQRLLIRNPDDPQVLERITALRDQMERGAVEPEPVDQEEIRRALRQRSIRALNDWLRRMREERHVS